MHVGMHHARTRESHKHPPRQWLTRLMDDSVYLAGGISVAANIPQLYTILVHKNASGVSALSWTGFLMGSLFWLGYGIVHKEKPIIVINFMIAMVQLAIIAALLVP
jgi:uncharacterized protein with PQ loop repeat